MTKEELAQLRYLRREVEGDKERLRQLQHWAKGQSSQGKLLPEQYEKPVRRLEKRIQRNLQTHLEQLERLESFLAGVEDSRMRLILELRYGRGLTWHSCDTALAQQCHAVGTTVFWPARKLENRHCMMWISTPALL